MTLTFDAVRLEHAGFVLEANFSIQTGRRVAVIGPSGGGKSTLLAALAGFQTPTAGRIFALSRDITHAHPPDRPVTLLFQDHNLFPHMTALQNVGLGLRPNLKLSQPEWRIVRDALGRVGLRGQEDKRPAALSGGQQQRVAIARALLRCKPVLLLDEPFAALGPALRGEMLDLVCTVTDQTNATLLMVTHAPEDAKRLGDQTVLVEGGIAHPPEDTKKLFARPPAALQRYLGE